MLAILKILHGNFVHDLTKLPPSMLGDLRPGDSALLGVINTAVTRGENKVHSRGGGGPVRKDTSPKKQKQKQRKKTEGENSLDQVTKSPHGEPRTRLDF